MDDRWTASSSPTVRASGSASQPDLQREHKSSALRVAATIFRRAPSLYGTVSTMVSHLTKKGDVLQRHRAVNRRSFCKII